MHTLANKPVWQKLLVLVAAVALSAVCSEFAHHYLADQFEATFGLLAVVIVGIFCGPRFGLVAALFSGLITGLEFREPSVTLGVPSAGAVVKFLIFLIVSAAVLGIIHRLQRYAADLEAKERALRIARQESESEHLLRCTAESNFTRESLRFKTILSGLLDAVVSVDREGTVRYVNAAAAAFSGIDASECLGKPVSEMWSIESRRSGEKIRLPILAAIEGDRAIHPADDLVLVPAAGRSRDVEIGASVLHDEHGEMVGAVSILRDISDKRASEIRFREHEQRFRLATDAANIGVWLWYPDSGVALWNRSLTRMMGRGDTEFEGLIDDFFQCVAPEELAGLQEVMRIAIENHESFYREFRMVDRAGKPFWMAGGGGGVYDEKTGETRFVAGVSIDITGRKIAEERIRSLNASLAESTARLSRVNDDLQERTRQLESILAERTAFLSSMSHELRTPLHSISGFLELLLEDPASEGLNDRQRRFLRNIESSAHHLIRVVNDVLDLSRISAGRLRLSAEAFDLREVAEAVVDESRPIALDHQVSLTLNGEDHPILFADRERLHQILMNLVSNAIKFTPSGGEVKVSLGSSRESVFAAVDDTGIGIAPADLSRIFEEFEQVHHPTFRPKLRGSGLGLAITRKLVELQGGGIDVESKPGEGSKFRVTFPAYRPGEEPGAKL